MNESDCRRSESAASLVKRHCKVPIDECKVQSAGYLLIRPAFQWALFIFHVAFGTLHSTRFRWSLLFFALFSGGCGGGPPAPVPSGLTSGDWYAIAEAAPPGFVLTDGVPSMARLNKDHVAVAGDFPLTTPDRNCPEQPGAASNQPFASVVDPAPGPGAELREVTLNGLVVDECQLWRERYAVFSKKVPPRQIGKRSHDFQVTRFDSQTWQKDAELSIPAFDSVWDLSANGRWLLSQRRSTNDLAALGSGRRAQRHVDLWDFANSKFVASWEPYVDRGDEYSSVVVGAAMISDDEAVTCSAAGELVWWKLPACKAIRRIPHFAASSFVMTPGRRYVGVFDGVTFCFYDARTGAPHGRLEDRHRHFLEIRSVEFRPSRTRADNASGLSSGGDELLAWASSGGLQILVRWSLHDGRLLSFMPVTGSVNEGLRGVRWLRPPFALIGDWVADLAANRFVGRIDPRPRDARQLLNGPDGRLWIHTSLNRLFPVDLPNADWLLAGSSGSVAPLPLGPLAKVKVKVQIPTKPANVPDFESELVTSLASHLKSWGTQIVKDGAATLAVELDFKATGNSIVAQTFRRQLNGLPEDKPMGTIKLPEYLLAGTIRLENETGQICSQLRQSVSSVHIDLNNYPVKGDAWLHHDLQVMTWNCWLRKIDQQLGQVLVSQEMELASISIEEAISGRTLSSSHRFAFSRFSSASSLSHPIVEWNKPQTKALSVDVPTWQYGSQAAPVVAQANPQPNLPIGTSPVNSAGGSSSPAAGVAAPREKDPILTAPRYSSATALAVTGVKSLAMPTPPRFHFVTCCANGSFQTWDPRTLKVFRSARHDEGVECIGFADSGASLVYATSDQRLRMYDLNGRTHTANIPVGEKFVRMLCTATGSALAVATESGKVLAFRVSQRNVDSQRLLCKCEGAVTGLQWADKAEKLLAVTSADGKCRIVDFKSGTLKQTLDPNAGGLLGVSASPSGKLIAVATYRDGVQAFDADTGEVAQRFEPGRSCFAVRFSNDGELLLCGGDNGRILAWRLKDREVAYAASGLTGRVREIHFSDDGLGLAAVSEDGTVRVWNVSQPPREPGAPRGFP